MKNQNDLICIVGCGLVALIAAVVMFFMKRDPISPPAPTAVITATPTYPAGTVVMAPALSGGSSMAGGGGFGGPGGPPPGMGGPGGMSAGKSRNFGKAPGSGGTIGPGSGRNAAGG